MHLPALLLLMLIPCMALTPAPAAAGQWPAFRDAFVQQGRVVDTGNKDISHSEGQGVGMLLAVRHNDRETFDVLWAWTQKHLQRPDGLYAWRWEPEKGVTDKNNATDGDLYIAWALREAGERWQRPELTAASRRITDTVRQKLWRDTPWGPVLLPGLEGFEREDGVVLNLSYWLLPFFDTLGEDWRQLSDAGVALLRHARFGRWQLPPDWLQLTDGAPASTGKAGEEPKEGNQEMVLPQGLRHQFGYDAIRIPLFLAWSGRADDELLAGMRNFWRFFDTAPFQPAWTDLDNNCVDSGGMAPGMRAIRILADGETPPPSTRLPLWQADQDYYSASLYLLVEQAMADRQGKSAAGSGAGRGTSNETP